jgi:tRNA-binding EMAP/Myf-like protein
MKKKSEITYDDFAKLELKAGTVTACVKVEKQISC